MDLRIFFLRYYSLEANYVVLNDFFGIFDWIWTVLKGLTFPRQVFELCPFVTYFLRFSGSGSSSHNSRRFGSFIVWRSCSCSYIFVCRIRLLSFFPLKSLHGKMQALIDLRLILVLSGLKTICWNRLWSFRGFLPICIAQDEEAGKDYATFLQYFYCQFRFGNNKTLWYF